LGFAAGATLQDNCKMFAERVDKLTSGQLLLARKGGGEARSQGEQVAHRAAGTHGKGAAPSALLGALSG
jgi:hypothetical protein